MWRHTFSFYCSQSDVIRWLQSLISQSDCKCSASKANQAGIPSPTPPPFFYSPSSLLQLGFFFTFSPLCRVAFYLMYYSCGCCFYARGVQKQWNKGTLWEFPWVWPRCCDLYCFTHQKQRFNCFWSQSATENNFSHSSQTVFYKHPTSERSFTVTFFTFVSVIIPTKGSGANADKPSNLALCLEPTCKILCVIGPSTRLEWDKNEVATRW